MFQIHKHKQLAPLEALLQETNVTITDTTLRGCASVIESQQAMLDSEAAVSIKQILDQLRVKKSAACEKIITAFVAVQKAYDNAPAADANGVIRVEIPSDWKGSLSESPTTYDWEKAHPYLSVMVRQLSDQLLLSKYSVTMTLPFIRHDEYTDYYMSSIPVHSYSGGNLVLVIQSPHFNV